MDERTEGGIRARQLIGGRRKEKEKGPKILGVVSRLRRTGKGGTV